MRCLRRIAHIQWKDKVPNTEVLQICNLTGIEAMLMTAQYRWVGHVTRMEDTRHPKITFYVELEHGTRCHGGQLKRYKDMLKTNTRACDLPPNELENLTADRSSWRCLTLSATVYCHFKTNVFDARPVVSYRQIVDSLVTSAVVSVHQGSVSSLTSELICDPEIRCVDGSVHPHLSAICFIVVLCPIV